MVIWYLAHSGFAVETKKHFLIFDYYRDTPGNHLSDGVIRPTELTEKQVVVFCSHRHHDHYNPVIFQWESSIPDIQYILSSDIPSDKGIHVKGDQCLNLDHMQIQTLSSTDEGVAFCVDLDGVCIYHAGDLNWWHWNGESDSYNQDMSLRYQRQINRLKGKTINLAFVPVDPRLEDKYRLGMDYLMKTLQPEFVIPMHLWERMEVFDWLKNSHLDYKNKILCYQHRGQKLFIKE